MIAGKSIFSTGEAAFAVDRFGLVVVWNEAVVQTFRYSETDAVGQKCWELLSGKDVFGNQSCCEGCALSSLVNCRHKVFLGPDRVST